MKILDLYAGIGGNRKQLCTSRTWRTYFKFNK